MRGRGQSIKMVGAIIHSDIWKEILSKAQQTLSEAHHF